MMRGRNNGLGGPRAGPMRGWLNSGTHTVAQGCFSDNRRCNSKLQHGRAQMELRAEANAALMLVAAEPISAPQPADDGKIGAREDEERHTERGRTRSA